MWFALEGQQGNQLSYAIKIFSGQFFFNFVINVNLAYWNGREEQIKTNLSQCIFVSLKHVLAIVLVLSVCRSIYSYVFAFFLITFLEWFCNSTIIIRKIGFVYHHG